MPSVAEQLHQAREARGLTVQQIAEITKIRSDHIRAIEEGNYNVFSAPVYIRGFVRSYCAILKIDVGPLMADLDAELGQTKKFAEPPPLTGRPRGVVDFATLQLSKIAWGRNAIVVGAVIVAILGGLGYWAWGRARKSDPLKGLQPGVYRPAQPGSGETLPLPKR
jgi:cytoskeleton protein RodZ